MSVSNLIPVIFLALSLLGLTLKPGLPFTVAYVTSALLYAFCSYLERQGKVKEAIQGKDFETLKGKVDSLMMGRVLR